MELLEIPVVLIVEDSDLLLEVTIEAFENAGYTAISASTGERAIFLLSATEKIDLLITDIRLPGNIDGWDIAEHARSRLPNIPIIYVTGYSSVEPRQVENSHLFTKPCRLSKLLDAARRLRLGQI